MIAITGGLHTTPTDVLNIHANLLPIHLEIDKICYRAATRIAMLPVSHPLHIPAKKSCNGRIRRHLSPLHQLMCNYKMQPDKTEMIKPTPRNLALMHKRPFQVSIMDNKEDLVEQEANTREAAKVYSDGSAMDSKVGAAAILIRKGRETCALHFHLETSKKHTVHEAELVGILLRLHLIKTD